MLRLPVNAGVVAVHAVDLEAGITTSTKPEGTAAALQLPATFQRSVLP